MPPAHPCFNRNKIRYFDISREGLAPELAERGVAHGDTVRRLHVLDHKDGKLHIGASGFFVTWEHLPGFRLLAPLVHVPGVLQVADAMYEWWAARRLGITKTAADAPAQPSTCALRANIGVDSTAGGKPSTSASR